MSGQIKLKLPSGGSKTIAAPDSAATETITLPAGTKTLATVENFTSTGIDDNATSTKLTTTSTGVDVTGTVVADGVNIEADNNHLIFKTAAGVTKWHNYLNGNDLVWYYGGEKLRIDSSGNVGIGTSSPTASLDVYGGYILTRDSSHSMMLAQNISGGVAAVGTTTNTPLALYTNNTEKLRIDSNGNMGLGVTPEGWHSTYNALQIGGLGCLSSYSTATITADTKLTNNAYRRSSDGAWSYIYGDAACEHELISGTHKLKVAGSGTADAAITWTTAMTIDNSGNFGIGRASSPNIHVYMESDKYNQVNRTTAGMVYAFFNSHTNGELLRFYNTLGGVVGSVSNTSTTTSYNTSSDYRLKTDVQPMTGATDRLKALNPVNFEWIADGTRVDGFLAHEAQEVVPEAVTGTKDAMTTEEYEVTPAVLDDDGNVVEEAVMGTREVPDYQGIDQSKLVPLLVATIQELEARITQLENS